MTSSPMVTAIPPKTDGSMATLIRTSLPVSFDSAADNLRVCSASRATTERTSATT